MTYLKASFPEASFPRASFGTCARRFAFILAAGLVIAPLLSWPAHAATKIQHLISPGGIEAWFVQDATVPLIAMEYAFGGGATQDPADKPGVGNLVADLIDEVSGVHLALILGLAPVTPMVLLRPEDAAMFALYSGMSILNWKFLLAGFLLFRLFALAAVSTRCRSTVKRW